MSGSSYNRYYTPLAGNVLVLPYPDEKHATLTTGKLDETGKLTDVDVPIFSTELKKGVVVEKGKDLPGEIPMVRRGSIVLYPRGAGHKIKIATLKSDGGHQEQEFDVLNVKNDILAIV